MALSFFSLYQSYMGFSQNLEQAMSIPFIINVFAKKY